MHIGNFASGKETTHITAGLLRCVAPFLNRIGQYEMGFLRGKKGGYWKNRQPYSTKAEEQVPKSTERFLEI